IKSLMDIVPILTEELIEVGKWLADHTMSFYISTFQAMLPQALKADYHKLIHRLTIDQLSEQLERAFAGRDYLDFDELEASDVPLSQFKQSLDDGDLEVIYQVKRKDNIKKQTFVKKV